MAKIVLREDVARVGRAGEAVTVANGYARNFLIPKGLAWPATEGTMRHAAKDALRLAERQARKLEQAKDLAGRLQKIEVTIKKPAGQEGKLFGTVTAHEIAQSLQAQQVSVDKRMISLPEPIKALGVYTVSIRVAPDVEAKVKVWVNKE